jgi:hypothetical protein
MGSRMRYEGFIGPSYTLDSKAIDSQRCVNWYPKFNETGRGKSGEVASLIGTPGLRLLATIGNGPIRGSFKASNGAFYVVSGRNLYRVNASWGSREIGQLETSSGAVDFEDNGTTLVIVDGPNGYTHTLGSFVLDKIESEAWRGSTKVEFIDGFFLFNDPDSGVFYISGVNSTTLDPLDFATAEGAPDNLIATLVNNRDIWLFGDSSIEVWYNSGAADFPFTRASSGFIEMGLAAAFSVAKIGNTKFWIGKTKEGQGIIYAAQGLSPQRISTHAVEYAIQSYGDISDAKAWTYQENGHSFYVINFTSANTTWVYDLTTRLWHERAYLNGGEYERHRADTHTFVNDTHVVGDYESGKLYALDSEHYSDNGAEIKRMRSAPHISSSNARIQYNSFELEAESGVGLSGNGQGVDPKVILQFSNDGGYTWSNEKWASLGKIGNKTTRAIWRRLGASRDRVYRVIVSDPVKANLIGVELNMERLQS